MERSYIAFISYKHVKRDAAIAKQIHTLIENYVIPKPLRKDSKKLGIVFRDEEELPISSDLTESICSALDASRYLIVVCSHEMKESIWVSREVEHFLKNHDARNAFVILADGEPADVFPQKLTHILNKETGEYQVVEPLALDARADTIGASLRKVKAQINKLYAGFLGCSYDSLVQREKHRRLKRLTALFMFGVLLAGCFTGMLFFKNRELSLKNDQLTEAIALAFMRESELLTEKADSALENGDVIDALRYASDALYSEDVERPYYGPAERALFSAVYDLHDNLLINKIELNHDAPVEEMVYSADGNTVYTINTYGKVSSFNSATGELRWNVKLEESSADHGTARNPRLLYDAESGIIVCYYDFIFSGLDAHSGKVCWQKAVENYMDSDVYFDANEKTFAYFDRKRIENQDDRLLDYYEYSFIAVSILDGSVKNQIPLERLNYIASSGNSVRFGRGMSFESCGTFTDSNRFAGTVFIGEAPASEALFFNIDMSENTVSYTENQTLDTDYSYLDTFFVQEDQALVLSDAHMNNTMLLQCFDLKTGEILWENIVESEVFASTASNMRCFPVRYKRGLLIGIGNCIIAVDYENGEILASKEFESSIVYMNTQSDGMNYLVLADGTHLLNWWNQYAIQDSSFINAMVSLSGTSDVIVHNGGLIQVTFTDSAIDSFIYMPPEEGGGSVTSLSEDGYTAYVTSIRSNQTLFETIPVEAKESTDVGIGWFADETSHGKVLTVLNDSYVVVDTQDHSFTTVRNDERNLASYSYAYLMADGQNIIACDARGEIICIDMDGTFSTLAEKDETMLDQNGELLGFIAQMAKASAARQTADGRVVAVRSDGRQLSCWIDGEEESLIPLPEDVCWSVVGSIQIHSMLQMGKNGLVVLSDFISEDVHEIDHFVVYDLASKEWKQIQDAAHGSAERPIALGECSPVFAVYDVDENIRIYDLDNQDTVRSLDIGLAVDSVDQIGMLLDDKYVYVTTREGQISIYCIETNERVFCETLGSIRSYWADPENDRMYLSTRWFFLCIDMRTWDQLFIQSSSFRFYNKAQNEIYVVGFDPESSSDAVQAISIPSTAELVDVVRNYLASIEKNESTSETNVYAE